MRQIKIHGLGGQGVVTAAKIFAEAVALGEDKYAQAIPAYGHERRGAPVYSDVIIDEAPIKLKSFVYNPDVVVLFDLSVIEKGIDVMAGVNEKTIFIINSPVVTIRSPFIKNPVFYVDAQRISLEVIKRDIPNAAMLGAMARAELAKIEAVTAAVEKTFGKAGAINAKAAQRAYDELKEQWC